MARKKRTKKKEREHKILVVAEEFKHRKDKKVAGGALAVLLKRLGLPGGTEGLRALGSDLVASKSGFTALLLAGYTAAIGTGWLVNMSGSESPPVAGFSVFEKIRDQDAALAAAAEGKSAALRKTLRNSLGRGNLSSARSGRPYDGGRGKVNRIGETSDASTSGGPGTGGKTTSGKPNANTVKNLKDVKPPPKVKFAKNKIPYQNKVNMAMIALAAAAALMFMGGWLKQKADALLAAGNSAGMAMMNNVKIVAGISTAAALAAVAIGSQLMQAEGQNMQGLTFMTSGGIIAFRAGMILFDSMSAKKAETEVMTATSGAIANTQALKG